MSKKHHQVLIVLLVFFIFFIGFTIGYMTHLVMITTQASQKQAAIGLTFPGPETATPTQQASVAQSASSISTSQPIPLSTPAIGGPQPPNGYYCIDDVDPDMCDDNSSHLVPKGASSILGTCGSVIDQAHKLVMALPQDNKIDGGAGVRDYLLTSVSNSCATTGPYSKGQYVSSLFVIDAFNLAGYSELSKTNPAHVSPSGMFSWWQNPPASYAYIPYTTSAIQAYGTGQKDLTGCVMFLKTGSSYHIGIVNKLEVFTPGGDGVISILQAGTKMYIDRLPVVGWAVRNSSTNQTTTDGLIGFGCHL